MTDHSELKRLAEAATPGPWYQHGGIMQVLSHDCETVCETFEDDGECPDAQFIAAANPAAVLALIAESERIESERADLWRGKRDVEGDRDTKSAVIAELKAEVAGLKTGYEAYERVNAELKAEVEALRKLGPSKEIIWCACGDGYPVNSYGAGFMAANGDVCENCDAANGRVEPHLDTPDELKALRQALTDIFNHVEGNTECLVRDLVNWGTPRINPNDFYDECEAIKEIANAALGQGEQS